MKKRVISLTLILSVLFVGLSGRIGTIIFGKDYAVSDGYNSYSVTIDRKYTTIYYRDMNPATNNKYQYSAVIKPNSKSILEAKKILLKDKYDDVLKELEKGYPVVVNLSSRPDVKLDYIKIHAAYKSDHKCYQLFSPASNGLLKYASEQIGEKKILYTVDAKDRLLEGDYGQYIEDNYSSLKGYRVSIDRELQELAVKASEGMNSGVVLIMNISDSSILACVNRPFDNYNIKALSKYSVGSVFKLIISACALENNIIPEYNCTGSIVVGDTTFSCQSSHIHKNQNLKTALANSCNCYFVNLALTLGADRITETARKMGYFSETKLFDGWTVSNSVFPSQTVLSSKGQLALLGFGQGQLLATPLQIASGLCTIGSYGTYRSPQLVLSDVESNGVSKNLKAPSSKKVLKDSTCRQLISYMRYVVTNGTGRNAEDSRNKSAGKTATAQTGQYIFGNELMNTWFAGIYPYDNPKYSIVIMTEKGNTGAEDCCPIFRTIVENL